MKHRYNFFPLENHGMASLAYKVDLKEGLSDTFSNDIQYGAIFSLV